MIARLRKSDVLLHAAIVFGGVVVANVFNYLFYMLIGRRAGVVIYGEVTSLASALLVIGAPANVGQLIVARLAAGLDAHGDKASLRRLGDLVTMWTGAAAAVVFVLVLLLRAPIASFFNLTETAPVVAAGATLAALLVAYVQRGVLQGAHLFEDFSYSLSLETITKLVVGVALVAPFGATGALSGVAAGLVLAASFNFFSFHRRFGGGRATVAFDRATLTRIVSGVGLGQLTLTVLTFYDVPLVKHAFDARTAGLYAAAALVGRAVIGACMFVPTIILPKANARAAAGQSTLPLLLAALGLGTAVVAVAVVASALAPRFVVTTIAGRPFGDAAPLVLLYVLASGALSLAYVVASYNFGLHRYEFVVPAFVVACAEIATLAVWHPSLHAIVAVLATGHACVLAATLYRSSARVPAGPLRVDESDPIGTGEPIG
ncbi:MAG: sugar isomerase [Candidatus Eremiobacteraeota bacterium]|nr:sugar isomerase [Candidatus Eremiobacteraeota bacterium]